VVKALHTQREKALIAILVLVGVAGATVPSVGLLLMAMVLGMLLLKRPRAMALLAVATTPLANLGVLRIGIVDLRATQLLWSAIFMAMLAQNLMRGRLVMRKAAVWLPLALFVAAQFASLATTLHLKIGARESLQFLYLVAIFYVLYHILGSRQAVRYAIVTLLVATAIFVFFGLLTMTIGKPPLPFITLQLGEGLQIRADWLGPFKRLTGRELTTMIGGHSVRRATSFYLAPVAVGSFLTQMIIVAVALGTGHGMAPWKRLTYGLLIAGALVVWFLTFSRASWVTLPIALVLLAFLKGRGRLAILLTILLIAALVLSSAAARARILGSLSLREPSVSRHLIYWRSAWAMFQDRLLLGHGPGSFGPEATNYIPLFGDITFKNPAVHNMFLQVAAETGLIGLLAIIWTLLAIFGALWRALRSEVTGSYKELLLGLSLALLAGVAINMTLNLFNHEIFWVLLAIGYAAARATPLEWEESGR